MIGLPLVSKCLSLFFLRFSIPQVCSYGLQIVAGNFVGNIQKFNQLFAPASNIVGSASTSSIFTSLLVSDDRACCAVL